MRKKTSTKTPDADAQSELVEDLREADIVAATSQTATMFTAVIVGGTVEGVRLRDRYRHTRCDTVTRLGHALTLKYATETPLLMYCIHCGKAVPTSECEWNLT